MILATGPWSPRSLAAQATTITLRGIVSASDGSVPRFLHIEVRNRDTGGTRDVVGDSSGAWRVSGLAPGIYDVTVRALGYRQRRTDGVQLVVGQPAEGGATAAV